MTLEELKLKLEEVKMKLVVANPHTEWLSIHDLAAEKTQLEAKIESLAAKELFKATPEELGKAAVEGAKVKKPEPLVVDHALNEKDLVPAGAIAAMAEATLSLPKVDKEVQKAVDETVDNPPIKYI